MNGGADAAAGRGMNFSITLSGSWAVNDLFTLTFTDALTALQTQIGAGYVSGVAPTYVFTFGEKMYALARSSMYFSAVGSSIIWNDPNAAGNGFLTLSNTFGIAEDLEAVGVFQGKLAIASRNTVQIWSVDPDPALNARGQVLPNIGTFAKDSLQSIGDRDVIMLHDSGFRSLRPRDASNNASVIDIGTPVDSFVQAALQTLSEAEKATARGVVEPSANRYWCYLPAAGGAVGSIYVLSSFPGSQVEAWSTYTPSYLKGESTPAYVIAPTSYLPFGAGYEPGVTFLWTQTAVYTGLTVGMTYFWTKGANDYKLNYGSGTLFESGTFIATQTTCYSMGSYTGLDASITGVLTGYSAGALVATTYALTTFVPDKFAVYQGKVYARAGDNIFLYGGQSGITYDACGVNGRTPYLDCDSPATPKDFTALDAAFQGTWNIKIGTDYNADTFTSIFTNNVPTFRNPKIPINRKATHIALDFTETGSAYARFSNAMIHFQVLHGR